ncbi:hypothetical protein ABTJ50_21505, partial [Acinetobacter baumannii]
DLATTRDAGEMKDFSQAKRHTMTLALIRQMRQVGVEFPARADNTPANLARLVDSETRRLKPSLEANKVQLD